NDLRHLVELERAQRRLLEGAYRETVGALAAALESKDVATGAHSERVQRYALALAKRIDPDLAEDSSAQAGLLPHDVRQVGRPDREAGRCRDPKRERRRRAGRLFDAGGRAAPPQPDDALRGVELAFAAA